MMKLIEKDHFDKIVKEKNKIIDAFQLKEIYLIDLIIKKGLLKPGTLQDLLQSTTSYNSDYLDELVKEWDLKYKPEKDWWNGKVGDGNLSSMSFYVRNDKGLTKVANIGEVINESENRNTDQT